jgi:hypothetical protein
MSNLFSYKLELLKQEMEMLQSSIRGYDSVLFTIKGWAITVFSGIILFIVDKQKPLLYLFCIACVFAFWLVDAFYKTTQNFLIYRYRKIEELMQSPVFEEIIKHRDFGNFRVPYFQEGWFYTEKRERFRLILKAALQGHTYVLYVFLLTLAVAMSLLFR